MHKLTYTFLYLILTSSLFAQLDKWPVIQLPHEYNVLRTAVQDKDYNIYTFCNLQIGYFVDTTETYVDSSFLYIYKHDMHGNLIWSLDRIFLESPDSPFSPSSGTYVLDAIMEDSSIYILGRMQNLRLLTEFILEINLDGSIVRNSLILADDYYTPWRFLLGDYFYMMGPDRNIYRISKSDRNEIELFYQIPNTITNMGYFIGVVNDQLFYYSYNKYEATDKLKLYYLDENARVTDSIFSPYGGNRFCLDKDTLFFLYPGFVKIVDKQVQYHLDDLIQYQHSSVPHTFFRKKDGTFTGHGVSSLLGIPAIFFIRLNELGEYILSFVYNTFYMRLNEATQIFETPLGMVIAGNIYWQFENPGAYLVLIDDEGFIITSDQKEDIPKTSLIRMYPNPVSDILTIEKINENPGRMLITDMNGRTISTQLIHGEFSQISLSHLPAGPYIFTFIEDNSHKPVSGVIIKTD